MSLSIENFVKNYKPNPSAISNDNILTVIWEVVLDFKALEMEHH